MRQTCARTKFQIGHETILNYNFGWDNYHNSQRSNESDNLLITLILSVSLEKTARFATLCHGVCLIHECVDTSLTTITYLARKQAKGNHVAEGR